MAVNFITERKKQKYLILVFIAMVVATGIVIWWGFFKEEEKLSKKEVIPPRKINIDKEFLRGEFLKESKSYERIPPLEEEKKGRENPFLPF